MKYYFPDLNETIKDATKIPGNNEIDVFNFIMDAAKYAYNQGMFWIPHEPIRFIIIDNNGGEYPFDVWLIMCFTRPVFSSVARWDIDND